MSRKNFVAWYIRENPLTLNLLRRSQQNPEIYECIGTEMEWQAWKAATEEQAEQLTIAKQRIAELEKCIERQAKAALSGMDSAKAHGVEALRIAQQKEAALNPELIESEREVNAVLTEENEKLIEVIRQGSHRIAELEKDCDILAYNLDAAHTINKNQVQNCEAAYKYAFSMRDLVIARDAEIERLKSAKHMIVSCADRMPTDDDADYNGQVWAMCGNEWYLLCYSNPMLADGRAKMWAATGLEKPEIDLGGRNDYQRPN